MSFSKNFADTMRQDHQVTLGIKVRGQYFWFFWAKRPHARYTAEFRRRDKTAMVAVWLDSGDRDANKTLFDRLEQYRDQIESVTGQLDWDRRDSFKPSRISVERPCTIDDHVETLDEIRAWMVEKLLVFHKAFQPILEELIQHEPYQDFYDEELEDESAE